MKQGSILILFIALIVIVFFMLGVYTSDIGKKDFSVRAGDVIKTTDGHEWSIYCLEGQGRITHFKYCEKCKEDEK